LRFFSAHILKTVRFFPEMSVKNAKRRPKIITVMSVTFLLANAYGNTASKNSLTVLANADTHV